MKRVAIARARQLRRNLTDAEKQLWRRLRQQQISSCKFRRQQPIGRYIADFVCFEKKLIVEVDGGQHADHASADSRRTIWLEGQGFRVLRFWNHDVLRNLDGVVEAIQQTLDTPTPILPHQGGGK